MFKKKKKSCVIITFKIRTSSLLQPTGGSLQELTVHVLSDSLFSDIILIIEICHGECIYTTEIGKHYNLGFVLVAGRVRVSE